MTLTNDQWCTLRAALERIIPPDEYPGAWECGVGEYLARQFDRDLRPRLDDYRDGLTALEAESVARFQQGFITLTEEEQDTLLSHIEAGEVVANWNVLPGRFFSLLVNATAEGFYSEPEQGGNRNAVSWEMVGFEERRQ
jgi:hypothetical protein